MELEIGDIVTINENIKSVVNWKNSFDELNILDIYDKGGGWIVAILDQYYLDTEGKEKNEILLSNLKKNIVSTRRKIIDDLLND
mgnify:CR=1 FL=1